MRRAKHYIQRIRDSKRPIRFLLSRLLWQLGWSRLFTIDRGLFRLKFFPTYLSAYAWLYPQVLRADERFCISYLKSGDVMVDIGANIGTTTLTAAAVVGDSGSVLSIEAHPVTFQYLEKNVGMNSFGNIHLFNVAVGEERGVISFSDKRSDTQNRVEAGHKMTVPIEKLDDVLPLNDHGTIDLLKIDVEGYEKQVFQGGLQTLKMTDCVFFESLDQWSNFYGYNSSEVLEILRSCGFKIYDLKGTKQNLLAIRDLPKFLERAKDLDISELEPQETRA